MLNIAKFEFFLRQQCQTKSTASVLLASSGGLDSMVLASLFLALKQPFAIAHCNFQLRGIASDGDALFLKNYAQTLGIPFYSQNFDTADIAQSEKISIQMAARDLRYTWLEQLRKTKNFDVIATAHHQNDQLETLIFRLAKGTGLRGLKGMHARRGQIIRPLLSASRAQIEMYAQKHQIQWREDASNAEDKYARNRIRHHIIPQMERINPNLIENSQQTLERLSGAEEFVEAYTQHFIANHCQNKKQAWLINMKALQKSPAPPVLLYRLLEPYGFNYAQCQNIIADLNGKAGAVFYAQNYGLLRDREALILKKMEKSEAKHTLIFTIEKETSEVELPIGKLELRQIEVTPAFQLSQESAVADFDSQLLQFPLTVRIVQPADRFAPLGMKGKMKKINRFLTDQKINTFEKKQTYVLLSKNKIAWVINRRIDERFAYQLDTKKILRITFVPNDK
ncbi:MAG: tRNA lysidine(34) synthetase TilS [Bernardetiaceae bacterium]|nr:tRNA lysidine(34) synthetase TilS [Bernardetiaceae bacterium]